MQSNQRMLKIVGFEVLNRESSRGIFVTLVDVCPGGFNIRVLNGFFFFKLCFALCFYLQNDEFNYCAMEFKSKSIEILSVIVIKRRVKK